MSTDNIDTASVLLLVLIFNKTVNASSCTPFAAKATAEVDLRSTAATTDADICPSNTATESHKTGTFKQQ